MSEAIPINLIYLPGSGQVCLADDKNLTPKAIAQGNIVIEDELAALPEVNALGDDDVVVDVGAFVGDTALIFARKAPYVYAFEPQIDAWICARWNLREFGNVSLINSAVGDGEAVFTTQEQICDNPGTRGVQFGGDKRSIRIDDMELSFLDFLKIDCEGMEPLVIRGAMETIRILQPVILVEIYHEMLARYGFTRDDVVAPLLDLGYTYRCAIGSEDEPRFDLLFKML